MKFHGYITALVTPFRNGEVDFPAFDNLIERQIDAGIHGLVISGTTGETPCLTPAEHASIVDRAIAVVKGRIPVIIGTGTNNTATTIEKTKHAQSAGADGVLVVTPYYNKPSQEGLYQHYKAVAENTDIPLIIYNIPGRCIVDMSVDTFGRLAAYKNVAGIKDSTGDMSRVAALQNAMGPDFCQTTGEDAGMFEYLSHGGHGCISVASNAVPDLCVAMYDAWIKGDKAEAQRLHDQIMPLHKALFVEPSPQPVKYALSAMDLCTDEVRLPLVPASQNTRELIDGVLSDLNNNCHPSKTACC